MVWPFSKKSALPANKPVSVQPWSEDAAVAAGMLRHHAHVVAVAFRSVREIPSDWTIEQHTATNAKLKMVVWMSNRFYATAIKGVGFEVGGQTESNAEPVAAQGWRRELIHLLEHIAIARLDAAFDQCLREALPAPENPDHGVHVEI